jgi:ABC-type nitrate/sulfonate/bicarbonate transport system permease component
VTWRQWVDPVPLPSPLATFASLWHGMDGGPLGFDFVKTVYRAAASTLIAAVIAIPLGIVLGSSERLYRSLEFVIDFFRSTPASAMFPLFLVLFGVGDETKIAVAAFGAALVILFNVAYGVMNARKTRLLAAKVMGASELRILFDVCCWSRCRRLLSACATAYRLLWSSSWWRKCSSARRTGSATACSRRSNCSTCRACMRRFSPPARWAMDSTFCSCS